MKRFNSFAEFYPFYLLEHKDPVCRRLHYIGSSLVVVVLVYALLSSEYSWFWALPIIGYGFAWVGHFFFEKNKPATFKHLFYSFFADWVMFKDAILSAMGHPTPLDNLD